MFTMVYQQENESERQDQPVKTMNDVIQCFPVMIALMTDKYGFNLSQGTVYITSLSAAA